MPIEYVVTVDSPSPTRAPPEPYIVADDLTDDVDRVMAEHERIRKHAGTDDDIEAMLAKAEQATNRMKKGMGPLEGKSAAAAAAALAAASGAASARGARPGPTPSAGFTRSGRARAVTHNLKIKPPSKAGLDFADVLTSASERREAARKARAATRPSIATPSFARPLRSGRRHQVDPTAGLRSGASLEEQARAAVSAANAPFNGQDVAKAKAKRPTSRGRAAAGRRAAKQDRDTETKASRLRRQAVEGQYAEQRWSERQGAHQARMDELKKEACKALLDQMRAEEVAEIRAKTKRERVMPRLLARHQQAWSGCGAQQHRLSSNMMVPITSDCDEMRSLRSQWP